MSTDKDLLININDIPVKSIKYMLCKTYLMIILCVYHIIGSILYITIGVYKINECDLNNYRLSVVLNIFNIISLLFGIIIFGYILFCFDILFIFRGVSLKKHKIDPETTEYYKIVRCGYIFYFFYHLIVVLGTLYIILYTTVCKSKIYDFSKIYLAISIIIQFLICICSELFVNV